MTSLTVNNADARGSAHQVCKDSAFCTVVTHRVVKIALLAPLLRTDTAPHVHNLHQQFSAVPKHCSNLQFLCTDMLCWHKKQRVWPIDVQKNCVLQQAFGIVMCQPSQ